MSGVTYIPAGSGVEFRVNPIETITDPGAPTAAELNEGIRLNPFLRGGVSVPEPTQWLPSGNMDDAFEPVTPGTFGGQPGALNEVLRYSAAPEDGAWTTLPRGSQWYLCISEYPLATPKVWSAGDTVTIRHIQIGSRNRGDDTRDQLRVFTVEFGILAPAWEDLTVLAGGS